MTYKEMLKTAVTSCRQMMMEMKKPEMDPNELQRCFNKVKCDVEDLIKNRRTEIYKSEEKDYE